MRRRKTFLLLALLGALILGGVAPVAGVARAAAGGWSPTGSMGIARQGHAAVRLVDGRVFVVGGFGGGNDLSSAERYDPATGTWASAGSMNDGYGGYQTATLLKDGTVLVAVGYNRPGGFLIKDEIYDPSGDTWTPTGPLNTGR